MCSGATRSGPSGETRDEVGRGSALLFGELYGRSAAPFLVFSEPQPMGKLDRRHSLKMNQRKAQAKKKIRLAKPKSAKALAAAAAPPKKTRSKAAAEKASADSSS